MRDLSLKCHESESKVYHVIKQNFSEDWKLAIELSGFEEILHFLGMQLYKEVSLF